jgi:hypothetical protein
LQRRNFFGLLIQLIFEVPLLDYTLFELKLKVCQSTLELAVFVAQALDLLLKPPLVLPERVYLKLQLITQLKLPIDCVRVWKPVLYDFIISVRRE